MEVQFCWTEQIRAEQVGVRTTVKPEGRRSLVESKGWRDEA